MNYNIQYLTEMRTDDNDNCEKHKLMERIDSAVSNVKNKILFHIVPVLYTIVCFSGCCVFTYKIIF